jgi:hypothetical protein
MALIAHLKANDAGTAMVDAANGDASTSNYGGAPRIELGTVFGESRYVMSVPFKDKGFMTNPGFFTYNPGGSTTSTYTIGVLVRLVTRRWSGAIFRDSGSNFHPRMWNGNWDNFGATVSGADDAGHWIWLIFRGDGTGQNALRNNEVIYSAPTTPRSVQLGATFYFGCYTTSFIPNCDYAEWRIYDSYETDFSSWPGFNADSQITDEVNEKWSSGEKSVGWHYITEEDTVPDPDYYGTIDEPSANEYRMWFSTGTCWGALLRMFESRRRIYIKLEYRIDADPTFFENLGPTIQIFGLYPEADRSNAVVRLRWDWTTPADFTSDEILIGGSAQPLPTTTIKNGAWNIVEFSGHEDGSWLKFNGVRTDLPGVHADWEDLMIGPNLGVHFWYGGIRVRNIELDQKQITPASPAMVYEFT